MNVMKKAWVIAREGAQKFGGKAREYFAQALRMAWALIKKGADVMDNKFGFVELKKLNGVLYFFLDDIDGLKVNIVSTQRNFRTGKEYVKREELSYKAGMHNELNKRMRLYNIVLEMPSLEITCGNDSVVLEINRGKLNWR